MIEHQADVVIVGTGIAGSILAHQLGKIGLKVLLIEAGPAISPSREDNVELFYKDSKKFPESAYPLNVNAPNARVEHLGEKGKWKDRSATYLDQSQSPMPFGSTYERRAGGTVWHWSGTSLRFVPSDFRLKSKYGVGEDWPLTYDDLARRPGGHTMSYYDMAEHEIGVSADVAQQKYLGIDFEPGYQYPNPPIPETLTDRFFRLGLENTREQFDSLPVQVSPTPAGRMSRPSLTRRACSGNTSCIPICPTQAKYDPTITLHKAFGTGHVRCLFQAVAYRLQLAADGKQVTGVEIIPYADPCKVSPSPPEYARGRIYVIAANAIETPKLLLNSGLKNSSIGKYLMDHPFFLRQGLTPRPTYPYRGPLATSGIESLRDGPFRKSRAAFRVELGNEGWNLAGDPYTTTLDWIEGTDNSKTNGGRESLHGEKLLRKLNDILTRQCRLGFLVEQTPDAQNAVTLSDEKDKLGISRPRIKYGLSDYTKHGFVAANKLADQIFSRLGVKSRGKDREKMKDSPGYFNFEGMDFEYMGAGHIMGTCRMGTDEHSSVVDETLRSWEHHNLYVVGSSVFPAVGTANPTLTIAALSFRAADAIRIALGTM